jgi:outer membrane protein assembly factor BamB
MHTFMRSAATLVLCLAATSLPIEAQRASTRDWTQYRGPNRDGVATTFTAPAAWPDTLVQKWRVEVGTGYASPIVVGSRVYVFSRRGEVEGMSAHDAASGREIWRVGYPAPFTMNSAAAQHNAGPKSTPVYVDGRLLTIGMTGIVTAWDAESGRQLWQKPGSNPVPLYTTHAFSPIVDGTTVIFHVGGHNQGALTAFDLTDGKQRWSWPGDGPGYGSPVIATIGGTKQVITITQVKVVGVDFATGALLWERPFKAPPDNNSNTPILHGETIIVSGNGGPTVAFTAARSGNSWTTTNVWENADIPLRLTNMVLIGDMLFGMTNRNAGQYFAVDAKSGRTLWTSPGRQASNAAIARAGDYLFSLEDDGELVVLKNSPAAFEVVKKYKVAPGDTWAEAAFSGNRIFIKDLNHLTLWTLS